MSSELIRWLEFVQHHFEVVVVTVLKLRLEHFGLIPKSIHIQGSEAFLIITGR